MADRREPPPPPPPPPPELTPDENPSLRDVPATQLSRTASVAAVEKKPSTQSNRSESKAILLGLNRINKDEKKIYVGGEVQTKTIDPATGAVRDIKSRYTNTLKLEEFVTGTQRDTPREHTEGSFKKVYDDYLKRKGRATSMKTKMPMKQRIQQYWVTQEIVERNPDIEFRLKVTMAELFTFIIFVILLTATFIADNHPAFYKYSFTQSVQREFFESKFINFQRHQMAYHTMKSSGDVWSYLTRKMVKSLHPSFYYNTDDMRIQPLKYFDNNPIFENGLIGSTRISIKTVRNDSCIVHYMFRRQFLGLCHGYFSNEAENQETFGTNVRWDWNEGLPDDTASWGEFGYYPPGGFSQILFWKSEIDSRALIYQMHTEKWITRGTRAMIVDFLLFNPTINFFSKVRMIMEFPPEGGINPLREIKIGKMLYPIETRDFVTLGMYFAIGLYGIYYAIEEGRQIYSLMIRYFSYFKHLLNFCICAITLYIFFYIILKAFYYRPKIASMIRSVTLRRHISIDTLVSAESCFFQMIGILLCLCYMKIFFFLHFTRLMSLINVTVVRSTEHVMGYMIYLALVLIAFAFVARLLFGSQSPEFRSWITSIFSMYKILLGDFDYKEFVAGDRCMGPIFFATYLFTIYFFLAHMFLAIVSETYAQTKTEKDRFGIEHALPFGKFINRGFWNTFGYIGQSSYAVREANRAKNALIRVKEALLLSNFSLTEINMFFAKYGIDGKKPIHPHDVHRILKDLERKGHVPMESPTTEDLHLVGKKGRTNKDTELVDDDILAEKAIRDWTGLTLKDLPSLMVRLRAAEKNIVKASRRVSIMADLIQKFDLTFWSSALTRRLTKRNNKLWIPTKTNKRYREMTKKTMIKPKKKGPNVA